jgi:hypothetical protein
MTSKTVSGLPAADNEILCWELPITVPCKTSVATHHARGVDAVEKLARLIGDEHGRLTALHHMLGPAHRVRRVRSEHLAGYQPGEEHAHGRQVLFDRRFGEGLLELLDVEGNVDRLDPLQRAATRYAGAGAI